MTRTDDSKLMILFVGGLCLVTIAMFIVIFVATRRPVVIMLPDSTGETSAVPVTSAETAAPTPGATAAAAPPPVVPILRVTSAPPLDPVSPEWNQITAIEVPLEPQMSAEPLLTQLSVTNIKVQAARDDQRYVWRISWQQPDPCFHSNVGQFSDAVALQFPMKDGAPYTMGGPDTPVTMLYWKALWQKDIDEGFQDVTDIYPNSWNDFYWFANQTGPQPIASGFDDPASHQYMSARAAGNPMADVARSKPVEELTAHGFGSSTHVTETASNASGVWQDGNWMVVFERPVSAGDPLIARFDQNPDQQLIAFAIWDGNAQNRGGRKHITNWIPMRIEQ